MKARVIKGGWFWKGLEQHVGDMIDMPEPWIANREADKLVERIDERAATPEAPPRIETAAVAPSETAMTPTPRARAKTR